MVVVAMLLGFMGYILILNLIQVLRIPLDYLTMAFALWNFSVTGLISVFWKGPMWVQQMYLTIMSSLMVCFVLQLLMRYVFPNRTCLTTFCFFNTCDCFNNNRPFL
jgi:hypothetical protein